MFFSRWMTLRSKLIIVAWIKVARTLKLSKSRAFPAWSRLLAAAPPASVMALCHSPPAPSFLLPAWFLLVFPQPQCEYSFPKVLS